MRPVIAYALCGLIAVFLQPNVRAEAPQLELSPIDLARGLLPQPAGVRSVDVFGCPWVAQSEPGKLVPTGAGADACAEQASRLNEGEEVVANSDLGPLTFFVPRLGIRDSAHWPAFHFAGARPLLSYEGGALRALACRVDDRWRSIAATAGDPLQVTDLDAVRWLRAGVRCAAERADGRVLHVLEPFSYASWAQSMAFLIAGPLPLLALLASLLVGLLFRRSVRRSLAVGAASPAAELEPPASEQSTPLDMLVLGEPGASKLLSKAQHRQRAQEFAYLATGGVCAVLIGLAYVASSDSPGSWRRLLVVTWAVAWPLIPTVAILRERPRTYLWLMPAYLVSLSLLGWFVADALKNVLVLGLIQFAYGAAAMCLLLLRRARAFAPWMLSTFVVMLLVVQLPYLFFVRDDSRIASQMMATLGMSASLGLYALFGVAALLALPLAFLAQRALAYGYQRLGLNDRLLILISFWFVYLAVLALANGQAVGWLAVAVIFAVPAGARLFTKIGSATPSARILYLRAFAARGQNLDLLARLRVYLLNAVRIEMIAGPDLADSLAEPSELLNFVSGRGGRKYLHSLEQFELQRTRERLGRDAEGRERVYEYYCSNAIWKDAFQRLAHDAQLALMDLRGMNEARGGCSYELTQLIHHVSTAQFIVVINQATDRALLRRIVDGAWSTMPGDARNASREARSLQVFEFDERRPGEELRLCAHICRALERYGHIDMESDRPGAYLPRAALER